jgi:hypothetical protein
LASCSVKVASSASNSSKLQSARMTKI